MGVSGGVTQTAVFKQATHINKELLALTSVVNALVEVSAGKKHVHVPYRDSKLTRILQVGGCTLG